MKRRKLIKKKCKIYRLGRKEELGSGVVLNPMFKEINIKKWNKERDPEPNPTQLSF